MSYKDAFKLFGTGDLDGTTGMIDDMLDEFGANVAVLTLSAQCAKMTGDRDEAERILQSCCEIAPGAQVFYNLGSFYLESGDRGSAVRCYKEAFDFDPSYLPSAEAYGDMLITAGFLQNAHGIVSKIVTVHPESAIGYTLAGRIMCQCGQADMAVDQFRKALEFEPDDITIYTHLLLALNYCPTIDEQVLVDSSGKWAELLQEKVQPDPPQKRAGTGRIRIGYVSGDFRRHSVAYFIEPILHYHDKEKFEVFGYSFASMPDDVTKRIKGMCDTWRDLRMTRSYQTAADVIKHDQIDILIDLGGITYKGIELFAYKPAPVQVTFLGYPNTTALTAINYRFTDGYCDPENNDKTDSSYLEELIRLNAGFLTFAPPDTSPEISEPPFVKNGYVTFGSFNTFAKVTDEVIDVWSKILNRVPGSKLLLKSKLFIEVESKDEVQFCFSKRGIGPDRLILREWTQTLESHLEVYGGVDIALDTFPYNGTTTTCESLWMGVPVVSRYGSVHRSRVGLSILSQLGMPSLATDSAREYIKQAVRMACNETRLRSLRKSLRSVVAHSPICDAQSTTREMEQYYSRWITAIDDKALV